MSEPKKHHFVPKFYLSNWCNEPSGKLHYFYWINNKFIPSPISPKFTAFEYNLYSLENVPPGQAQIVEKFLSKTIDGPASMIIKKIISEGPNTLSDDMRRNWAKFLLSLRYRNPPGINNARMWGRNNISIKLEEASEEYENRRQPEDPVSLEEFAKSRDPGFVENFGIKTLMEWICTTKHLGHILNMHWWTIDVSGNFYNLLTSDQPCIFTRGLGDPECLIVLPLNPSLIFFAANDLMIRNKFDSFSKNKIVKAVNVPIIGQAFKYGYAKDARQSKFIMNRLRKII